MATHEDVLLTSGTHEVLTACEGRQQSFTADATATSSFLTVVDWTRGYQ